MWDQLSCVPSHCWKARIRHRLRCNFLSPPAETVALRRSISRRTGSKGISLTRECRGCLHGRHQGWPVRHSRRSGAGVVAAAGETQRPIQCECSQALGERHGPDTLTVGQVDRRFRLEHDRGFDLRIALPGVAVAICPVAERRGAALGDSRCLDALDDRSTFLRIGGGCLTGFARAVGRRAAAAH